MAKVKIDMRILFKMLGEIRNEVGFERWTFEIVEKIAKKLGYTVTKELVEGKEVYEVKETGKKSTRTLNILTSILVHYIKKTGKSIEEIKKEVLEAIKS